MRKIVVILLGITLLGIACKPKKKEIVITPDIQKNHLQRNHLFGQVKEIITETIVLTYDEDSLLVEKTISANIQHYSADGFLKNIYTLNQKKDTIFKEMIRYSKDAKVIAHRKYDKNRNMVAESLFEYDKNGFKIGERHFDHDKESMTVQYKNDAIGNIIEIIQQKEEIILKNRFFYNVDGLVIKMEEYDPSGKLFKFITYEYDNYGDEVNRQVYDKKGKQLEYTYKTYNQRGAIQKILYEDIVHNLSSITYYTKHDKEGNWIESEHKKHNEIIYKQKRKILYY